MTDLPEPPALDPASLTGTEFTKGRRGFEPTEVRSALGRAADALRAWAERDARLREEIDDLRERLAEAEQLDEQRLTTVLGEETARIVAAARSAAAEIRSNATEEAERLLRESEESAAAAAAALTEAATAARDEADQARAEALEEAARVRVEATEAASAAIEAAQAEAAELRAEATAESTRLREAASSAAAELEEQAKVRHDELVARAEAVLAERTEEAEAVAAGLRETAEAEMEAARAEAEALRSEARQQADDEIERARSEGRDMVAEARDVRERMLRDLAERRRTARRQIEAARAGRDRITEALREVGRDLDEEVSRLAELDEEARRAGDAAAAALVDDVDIFVAEHTGASSADAAAPEGEAQADEAHGGTGTDESGVDDTSTGEAVADAGEAPDGDAAEASAVAETEDDDGSDQAGGPPSGDDDDASATVHDLFERIRAERAAEARRAVALGVDPEDLEDDLDGEGVDGSDDAEPLAGSPAASGGAGGAAGPAVADVITLDPATRTAADEEGGADDRAAAAVAVAADEAPTGAGVLDRRDELLEPVEKSLARTLKRLASDEQNEVLDRLRRVRKGPVQLDALLESGDLDSWTVALAPDMGTAADAGRELWAEQTGSPVGAEPAAEDLAAALRSRVEELLVNRRAHLQRVVDDADAAGLEPSEIADHLRAAYREWRSKSLGELAGDLATAGFALGTRSAAGEGTPWCWLPDHGGLPCADAEDNALAGTVPCGEPFPTGDVLPPAHPGCRCILVPAPS